MVKGYIAEVGCNYWFNRATKFLEVSIIVILKRKHADVRCVYLEFNAASPRITHKQLY